LQAVYGATINYGDFVFSSGFKVFFRKMILFVFIQKEAFIDTFSVTFRRPAAIQNTRFLSQEADRQ